MAFMEKKGALLPGSPLKSDKASPRSFTFFYIILIVSTIVLICFYSLPLNVGSGTLKPLSSEILSTLEDDSEIFKSLNSEEKSILSELFGEILSTRLSISDTNTSASLNSNFTETDIKPTIETDSKPTIFAVEETKSTKEDEVSYTTLGISKIESKPTFFSLQESKSTTEDEILPTDLPSTSENEGKLSNLSVEETKSTTEDEVLGSTLGTSASGSQQETIAREDKTDQSISKIQYLDTTKETKIMSPSSTDDESTVSSATRTVSNTHSANIQNVMEAKFGKKGKSLNTTVEFMPKEEFLVFSDHCKIPNIDPYHPSILKYIEEFPPLECKGEIPITKTEGNTLFIDKKAIRRRHLNISEISCQYMKIGRTDEGKSDDGVGFGFKKNLTDKAEIKSQFIRVVCSFLNGTDFYEGFHTFVHDKPVVEKRCDENNSSGYSVLIVGIDAMSRMNMHRQLKKTSRYLLNDMEAVQMYGFNKVGDNTLPNLIPLLTGYDERELKHVCWKGKKKEPLDKCNFAWKQYAKEGYRTFYAEDSPHMSTFNYLKEGFIYEPTDYYFRPFIIVMEEALGIARTLNTYVCVGNISETEVVLRWTEQFGSHFKDRKYFAFSWINGLTHDFLNKGSAVDHLYEKLFRSLHTSGALNKTIVIVMGDHGMRWGKIRKTYIGRLEERLPMLMIALPPEFKREYPIETEALQVNSRRLVTPFDLHATLMNILHLDKNFTFANHDNVNAELAENYTARANTLFQPVPEDRSCDDASIDEHWCTCENSLPVDTDDKIVVKAAKFLIDYINNLLKPQREKCAILKLKSITDARMWTAQEEHRGHSLNDTILTVVVKVKPSQAIFEGTVRTSELEKNRELLGTVSRLNLYGDQSACISDAILRKYCYCT